MGNANTFVMVMRETELICSCRIGEAAPLSEHSYRKRGRSLRPVPKHSVLR